MFAVFVMSCICTKECQRSVGKNETQDEKYFIVGISILVSGNIGKHLLTRKVDLQVFFGKVTCKLKGTHRVLKFMDI